MASSTMKQYVVRDASHARAQDNFSSLHLEEVSIPQLNDLDVLVRIHAVSLNFRDIMIASGTYIHDAKDGVVPCSDGAGEVVSIGSAVKRFRKGDRVATIFHQTHLSGKLELEDIKSGLGANLDGTLREYAVFNENGLVGIPEHLTMEEASTLPCAGVTAWNALMGGGSSLEAGQCVITQGTGAVSIFAAQFGVAAGAHVVATTSSDTKAEFLKSNGVEHTINYQHTPEWGRKAKELTPGGKGADFVIEIGGPETIEQSLTAVKLEGTVATIGQRTGQAGAKSKMAMLITDAFKYPCTIRRILLGSRDQFEGMNRFIVLHKLRPVVDKNVFSFQEAPQAFRYLWEQRHIGNVVVRIV